MNPDTLLPAAAPVRRDRPLRRFAISITLALAGLAASFAAPAVAADPAASSPSPAPALAPTSAPAAETARLAASDAQLHRDLQARLSRIAALRGVGARVDAGVATLTGEVPLDEDRQRAARLAKEVTGVVEVVNELNLDTSVAVRLRPALARATSVVERLVGALPLLVVAVVLVWAMAVAGRWLGDSRLLRRMAGDQPFLVDLLRQSVRLGMVLLGVVIALDLLDATALVSAVIGTAGLVGLALGFAMRDVVENYLAGLLLSLRQPFGPNDHVVIDGNEGKVASLTTRSTTLITLDGNHLRLPNALVFKGVILNYTRNPQRRFVFRVGAGTGEDLQQVRNVGLRALRSLPGILAEPPPLALILELAESTVTVEFSAWIDQRESGHFKMRSEAIRVVKEALDGAGISMPDPAMRVQLIQPPAATSAPMPPVPDAAAPADETGAGGPSVEDAIDRQLASEQAHSGSGNLLKHGAPRE